MKHNEVVTKLFKVANVFTFAELGIEGYINLCEEVEKDLYNLYRSEEVEWNAVIRLMRCELVLVKAGAQVKSEIMHKPIAKLYEMIPFLELAMTDNMFVEIAHKRCEEIYFTIG